MKRLSSSLLVSVAVIITLGVVFVHVSPTQALSTRSTYKKESKNVSNIKNHAVSVRLFTCGDQITDRDGYTYGTVQIGTQCWMAESLKTKTKPDSTPLTTFTNGSERDCSNSMGFHGTEADCDAGNAMYTWAATMNGSTTNGAQGLCMDGWHVPTDVEWSTLETYLTSPSQSCDASRVNAFDCADAGSDLLPKGSAAFNASLSGLRYIDGMFGDNFADFDYSAFFWSSTKSNGEVQIRSVNTDDNRVWRAPVDETNLSLSVRCIKN